MKYQLAFLFVLTFLSFQVSAQFTDDFSDGDFTLNPTWTGETPKFKISSSNQLQSQSTGVDTAYLATPSTVAMNAEWTFWAKQSFNSSANNHGRIYLISSQADLSDSLRGYFIQFGSSDDNISLYRQDGYDTTVILKGTNFSTGASVNTYRFKITRDASGLWEVLADPTGGNTFLPEGIITDNTYTTSSYFGVFCKHTSSNANKFYYDDFQVGNIVTDTIAPQLLTTEVIDPNNLRLSFSEALEPVSAGDDQNYIVNNGLGSPTNVSIQASNPSIVELFYTNAFQSGTLYEISASNITDLKGNSAQTLTQQFAYYKAQQYDILINEIMADPSPAVGLPEREYIELYNQSDFPVQLENWSLKVGSSEKVLSAFLLQPKAYLLLADDDAVSDLAVYGDVLSFSSFSLTNGGTSLVLTDTNGQHIHHVVYDDSWYSDPLKTEGGWSLEMQDIANPCGCERNWTASEDTRGGSPGADNSVVRSNPDLKAPELERISVQNPLVITLYFSEVMDSSTVLNASAYEVNLGIGTAVQVTGYGPDYKTVDLLLSNPLQTGNIYTLSLNANLKDCVGNVTDPDQTLLFGLPETPEEGDVIINEILFDPKDGGVDFVELYNRSDKIIDLRFLSLANWDFDLLQPDNQKTIIDESWLLFPSSYVVLSTDGASIHRHYFAKDPKAFLDMTSFISMSNSDGQVLLVSSNGEVFDRIDYTEEMHYDLLINTEGISLEKIHFDRESKNPNNWHSAAETAGYATPGYLNSQFSELVTPDGSVSIDPKIFSPDNDGRDDVVNIRLQLSETAQSCTIRIYDSSGRLVRRLATNSYINPDAVFTWDGIDEQNQKAGMGIYVVLVEVYDEKGNTEHYKEVITLGGMLR